MSEAGKYVFGILNSNADLRLTIPAALMSDGEAFPSTVYTIPHRDLSALVRDFHGPADLPRSKENLARLLLGHQSVIERIMVQGVTVIPMKLGTFVHGRDGVQAILRQGYPLMKEILKTIDDKIEIDVVATWSRFDAVLREAAEEKEIREFKERLLGLPGGATINDRMRIGHLIKEALDTKRGRASREILERLRPASEDLRVHDLRDDQMVLNAAFLIARAGHTAFEESIEELNRAWGEQLNFRCVGPLPPYSFCTLEARSFDFEEIEQARSKLGLVREQATRGEIKKAYRSLAFSSHPDRRPDLPGREKEFEEIAQAYKVLGDYCRNDVVSFKKAEFPGDALRIRVLGAPSL